MPRTAASIVALVSAAHLSLACGGVVDGAAGNDGTRDGGRADSSLPGPRAPDAGRSVDARNDRYDSGSKRHDAGVDAPPPAVVGGGPVDAGYYYGDGSFWVEGGAYPGLPDASAPDGTVGDAGAGDAGTGCGALSACCSGLSGTTQSLCNTIAGLGNAANCATELAELQSLGNCTGVTILTSQIQVAPNWLVSDGRLLFWTTSETPGLYAMPVDGGAITILLSGAVGGNFLAVDDVDVYVMQFTDLGKMNDIPLFRIIRIPKKGGTATLVNESGASVLAATTLGSTAYWLESATSTIGSGWDLPLAVRTGSLLGGPISRIAKWSRGADNPPDEIGVTNSTVFLVEPRNEGWNQQFFPMSAGPTKEESITGATACDFLVSDTDAAYCSQTTGSNLRVANDGTTTAIGTAISSSYIAFDDTYAYWADMTTVGTIVKAPKAGGGTATVLARDTSPTAIAVDATSVYWADMGGYIKRIPK